MPSPTELRRDIATLNREMARDISGLWRPFDVATDSITALRDTLPSIIDVYGTAAGAAAADWYDETRDEVGARRRFTAITADIADSGTQALIGWAAAEATDDSAFQTLLLGGAQRRMANFSRLTVSRSSIADPSAAGWRRVGVGECDFCRLLLGRGAVYTEASADFQAHDGCQCGAEPAWT